MLVLTRKMGECRYQKRVKSELAQKQIKVHRKEVYDKIKMKLVKAKSIGHGPMLE